MKLRMNLQKIFHPIVWSWRILDTYTLIQEDEYPNFFNLCCPAIMLNMLVKRCNYVWLYAYISSWLEVDLAVIIDILFCK